MNDFASIAARKGGHLAFFDTNGGDYFVHDVVGESPKSRRFPHEYHVARGWFPSENS